MTLAGVQAASPAYAPLNSSSATPTRAATSMRGHLRRRTICSPAMSRPTCGRWPRGRGQITPPRASTPAISPRTEQSVLHALVLRVALTGPARVAGGAGGGLGQPSAPASWTDCAPDPAFRLWRGSSIASVGAALLGVLAARPAPSHSTGLAERRRRRGYCDRGDSRRVVLAQRPRRQRPRRRCSPQRRQPSARPPSAQAAPPQTRRQRPFPHLYAGCHRHVPCCHRPIHRRRSSRQSHRRSSRRPQTQRRCRRPPRTDRSSVGL